MAVWWKKDIVQYSIGLYVYSPVLDYIQLYIIFYVLFRNTVTDTVELRQWTEQNNLKQVLTYSASLAALITLEEMASRSRAKLTHSKMCFSTVTGVCLLSWDKLQTVEEERCPIVRNCFCVLLQKKRVADSTELQTSKPQFYFAVQWGTKSIIELVALNHRFWGDFFVSSKFLHLKKIFALKWSLVFWGAYIPKGPL